MKKCIVPLKLLSFEKAYYSWIIIIFVSVFFSIFLSSEPLFFFTKDQGIIFSIALLVPFIPELLIPIIVDKKKKSEPKFLTYKIISALVNIVVVLLLLTLLKNISASQNQVQTMIITISFLSSILLSIYFYLITKMDSHQAYFSPYDDIPYSDEEDKRVEELSKKVNIIEKTGEIAL